MHGVPRDSGRLIRRPERSTMQLPLLSVFGKQEYRDEPQILLRSPRQLHS